MTDFLGPRLTASDGNIRANKFVKEKLESFGLANVVIDDVNPFERGGWHRSPPWAAPR